VAGRQLADALEGAQRGREIVVGQIAAERYRVESLWNPWVDEKGAQVGRENELLTVGPIEERFLTGAVAGQEQTLPRLVPHCKGEHSVEVFDEVGAVLLVEVGDGFGVGLGAKGVALRLEIGEEVGRVVDLAVADRPDRPVFVGKWWRFRGHVDDSQSSEAEGTIRSGLVALAVGAAMDHGLGHGVDQLPTLLVGPLAPQNADQTAHENLLSGPRILP
jgi:hypothetical protein